jgi:hypothetical protein
MPAISNLVLALWMAAAQPVSDPSDLAGLYDGGQTEMAAILALEPDGRFRYALSYGALDERAEGDWRREGDRVLLTSDPVQPPRFDLVEIGAGPEGALLVTLVAPRLPVQLFDVKAGFADGRTETVQMEEEGVRLAFPAGDPPRTIILSLPMFDVESDGYRLRFAFHPNDLGRIAFDETPLHQTEDGLNLMRHDRLLTFRRVEPGEREEPAE